MKIIANKNKVFLEDIETFSSGAFADKTIDVEFSEEFDKLTSFVTFNNTKVPVIANQIVTPELEKGICKIGVYGFAISGNELTLRLSPTPCEVLINQGTYNANLKDGLPPEESEYEKIYNLINQAIENGKLKGKDATINGRNAIEIEQGENVTITNTDTGIKISATGGSGTSLIQRAENREGGTVLSNGTQTGIYVVEVENQYSWKFNNKNGSITLKKGALIQYAVDFIYINGDIVLSDKRQRKQVSINKTTGIMELTEGSMSLDLGTSEAASPIKLSDVGTGTYGVVRGGYIGTAGGLSVYAGTGSQISIVLHNISGTNTLCATIQTGNSIGIVRDHFTADDKAITFVKSVEGKGLSTNDYTDEEKEKLASISESSIDDITVNNFSIIENKIAKIPVIKNNNEANNFGLVRVHTNDAFGLYIDSYTASLAVRFPIVSISGNENDFKITNTDGNYSLNFKGNNFVLTETFSSKVNELIEKNTTKQNTLTAGAGITITDNVIATTPHFQTKIVDLNDEGRPDVPRGEENPQILYLTPLTKGGDIDVLKEWLWIMYDEETQAYDWEPIGTTEIDLTNYYTKDEVDARIPDVSNKADKKDIPTLTSQLTNDSDFTTQQYVDSKIADVEMAKFPNATIIGAPTINNGQISNFTRNNYLKFPFLVNFQNRPFTINFDITTGANVVTQENILDSDYGLAFAIRNSRFVIAISTNGTSWNLGEGVGTLVVQPNTSYRIAISWNGVKYSIAYSINGGETYIDDIVINSTEAPFTKQMFIGVGENWEQVVNSFSGIINLNYANLIIADKIVWQGMDDVGIASRLAIDVSNIDEAGEQRIKEIAETDNKADKTVILFSIGDTLADNTEYRLGEQTAINIIEKLPLVADDKDFICSIVFTSGTTATRFDYDSIIKWSGEDLTDNKFVPVANKRYIVMLWYDGIWNGIARGVA